MKRTKINYDDKIKKLEEKRDLLDRQIKALKIEKARVNRITIKEIDKIMDSNKEVEWVIQYTPYTSSYSLTYRLPYRKEVCYPILEREQAENETINILRKKYKKIFREI